MLDGFLPARWRVAVGDHTYTFDWAGSRVAILVGLVVVVLAIVWALRVRPGALSRPIKGVVLAASVISMVMLMASGFPLVVNMGLHDAITPGRTTVSLVFREALLYELVATNLAAVSVVVAGLSCVARKRTTGPVGAGVLVLLTLGAAGAAYHPISLDPDQRLPRFEDTAPAWVHEGQPYQHEPRLSSSWAVEPVPVQVGGPTELRIQEVGARPPFGVEHLAMIPTMPERGDPRMPLQVGNRWVYRRALLRGGGVFFYALPEATTEIPKADLVVEVVGAEVVEGRREFVLRAGVEGSEAEELRVYAAEGQTRIAHGRGDDPALVPAVLGRCEGQAHEAEAVGVTAPCSCEGARRGTLGTVIVAISSVGLVVPGGDQLMLRLESSEVGEAGAAAVDMPPPPMPEPRAIACPPVEACAIAYGYDERPRYARLIGRLERAGLRVSVSRPDHRTRLEVRGPQEVVERELAVQLSWAAHDGRCPGDVVCRPSLKGKPTAKLSRSGVRGFEACASEGS